MQFFIQMTMPKYVAQIRCNLNLKRFSGRFYSKKKFVSFKKNVIYFS